MSTLGALLDAAPSVMAGKDAAAKSSHADKVFSALDRVGDKQIADVVSALSADSGDVLLKYVYKSLEKPSKDNNASLFKWQEKLLEKFGVGAVVRVLTDRKTA
ncbi:actin-related protein 2/3 complex subunit 5 [Pelagophyceae sp. CCMP2097]|nr:actin-related protein 2/3 complex subunit 5 [Pelagophyceae sp. CCMP2097]